MKSVQHHFVYVPTPPLGGLQIRHYSSSLMVCILNNKYNRINTNPLSFTKLYNFKNFLLSHYTEQHNNCKETNINPHVTDEEMSIRG